MIGHNVRFVCLLALALTACGRSGPGDTVEDFMQAAARIDIVQMDDLLRGEAREMFLYHFSRYSDEWRRESPIDIDIISEEIYDGQPVRAGVVVRYGSEVSEYELVMHDGTYKIADVEAAEYSEALPSEDGVGQGTGTGPRRTVVDFIRAREQGAGPGQLADLVYIPGEELRELMDWERDREERWAEPFAELSEAEWEEAWRSGLEEEYEQLQEQREQLVGPNENWLWMSMEVFDDGIYELAGMFHPSRVLSEDVYEGSTVRARVEVEIMEFGDPAELTFGLVMEDGLWRITALDFD